MRIVITPMHDAVVRRHLAIVAVAVCLALAGGKTLAGAQPNIIFVLADDLGWAELGCYGNGFNETPHLDGLGRRGMRFTQAYAAAPVCSPYRASLLTGQHPARVGILDYLRPNSANALSTDHVTLAEMFQQNGYATGMIGKWHLTGYEYHDAAHEVVPRDHGFQWDFAREVKSVGNGANFWPYVFRDQPIRWTDIPDNRLVDDEYLVDRMNSEAVDYIQRNKDRPFFLYLSHFAPHSILNGKPNVVQKYRDKHRPGKSSKTHCYLCQDQGHQGDALNHWASDHNPHLAAMLESIDDGIGMIAGKLDELGIAENTILIFTSDNGGETNVTSNAPLRGGKSQLYEGGIRVPLIVQWPGNIPADVVCDEPTVSIDFYPTLLEAAEIARDEKHALDGVSMLATWKNQSRPSLRESSDSFAERKTTNTMYWHYPLDRPHFLGGNSSGAIRDGDWKLIENFDSGTAELYSLADDASEQRDLADKQPEQVQRLKAKLAGWRVDMNATIPSAPLLVDPRKLDFADHFSTGQVSDRWFFTKDWTAERGVLRRNETGTENTRIFLTDAQFRDVMIRFDFQFQNSQDIRLVTGGSGGYNAVIHIRRDHFYIQTALDKSAPYFSYRHGECAYEFQRDRWYTMTIEFIGDQLVAHIDSDHLAYATHPILDRERGYFAFQVDQGSAALDNVQILGAKKHPAHAENVQRVRNLSNKYPVQKPLDEQFAIQKTNAHEWLYQRHDAYRALVKQVNDLDAKNKRLYPDVFRSHKEFQKENSEYRKQQRKAVQGDPAFKQLMDQRADAYRAQQAYLFEHDAELARLQALMEQG